ncbi:MAG: GDSL-like Lipase/Acylhydrolase family [Solirubrobacteraceae bacterium]|jgi:lysophospholipase L1-like esterase|nr:GDSL-like Lipase/Acylhydrolase family [Solirubrobacteraceae bacterium]
MTARNTSISLGFAVLAVVLALGAPGHPALAQIQMPEVLVVGDSLAVGTMPYLDMLLTDRNLTWDAVNGRTTPQGIHALRLDLRAVEPQAVVVSLGTNDGPDPLRFTRRLRLVLGDLSPHTCVIWTAIVRPPRKGPYRALNRALRAEAARDRRLVVINWDHAVKRGTVNLHDGLHADAAGYRYRSLKIAQAVHAGCPAV